MDRHPRRRLPAGKESLASVLPILFHRVGKRNTPSSQIYHAIRLQRPKKKVLRELAGKKCIILLTLEFLTIKIVFHQLSGNAKEPHSHHVSKKYSYFPQADICQDVGTRNMSSSPSQPSQMRKHQVFFLLRQNVVRNLPIATGRLNRFKILNHVKPQRNQRMRLHIRMVSMSMPTAMQKMMNSIMMKSRGCQRQIYLHCTGLRP